MPPSKLALEILEALCGQQKPRRKFASAKGNSERPEWQCPQCKQNNWCTRPKCRRCAAAKPDPQRKKQQQQQQQQQQQRHGNPTPAQTAAADGRSWLEVAKASLQKKAEILPTSLKTVKEESAAKVQALEAAVQQIGDNPLLAEYKLCLEADIASYKKKSVDSRSLAVRIEEKRAYIDREKKRISSLEEELQRITALKVQHEEALKEEEANLQSLNSQLARETLQEHPQQQPPPPPPQQQQQDVPMPDAPSAEEFALAQQELELLRQLAKKRSSGGEALEEQQMKDMLAQAKAIQQLASKKQRTGD